MHPLEAQTLWLLGAASAGDKEAKNSLGLIPIEPLADVYKPLLNLRDAVMDNNADLFRKTFPVIFRVELKQNERATAGIIRALAHADVEYAVRAMTMATTTLPTEKLIERLEVLVEALKKMQPHEPNGKPPTVGTG